MGFYKALVLLIVISVPTVALAGGPDLGPIALVFLIGLGIWWALFVLVSTKLAPLKLRKKVFWLSLLSFGAALAFFAKYAHGIYKALGFDFVPHEDRYLFMVFCYCALFVLIVGALRIASTKRA